MKKLRKKTYIGEFIFGNITLLLKATKIPIRQILAKSQNQNAHNDMKPARDEEGNPPSSEGSGTGSLDNIIKQRHDELSGSSTHVAPASSSAIDKANDLAVEHGAHPILTGDEGGKGESNHEPDGYVAASRGDKGHAEDSGSGEHDEKGAAVARAEKVTDSAHDKTRENAARDRGDSSVANVDFGEVKVVPNDGDERGCSEG